MAARPSTARPGHIAITIIGNTMELNSKLRPQKNNDEKYHPVWMVVILALSIVVATLVWVPGWVGSKSNYMPDRLPSLSPASTKIILVDVAEGVQNNLFARPG